MTSLRAMLLGAGLLVWGCAAGGVAGHRKSGDPAEVSRALGSAQASPRGPHNAGARPLVFLALTQPGAGERLVAVDLRAVRQLWSQPADVSGRVAVGHTLLVHSEADGGIVARSIDTGAVLWRRDQPTGATLAGYAVDGDDVYVVDRLAAGQPRDRGAHLVGLSASGRSRFRLDLPGGAGAPAARGGLVAVPYQSQFVGLVDGRSGTLLAEILSREEAAQFVAALPEGLFFGSRGVFLASAATASGSRQAPGYLQAKLPEFVRVVYHHDMYRPEQNAYSALDRNRILWRVAAGAARPGFTDGLVVVQSFRFFFGMEAATGKLRWVYNHPREDAVSSAHVGNAIVFATGDGAIGALDATTGRRRLLVSVPGLAGRGTVIKGATFDAEGWVPDGLGAAAAPPLHQALTSIIVDPDKRFSDVKLFALDELAAQPGREVTADLLNILEHGEGHPLLPQRATDALIARKDPAAVELYVAAVKAHPDYAESRRPQQLDVLARALTRLGAQAAVPALVEHLRLPDTNPSAVRDIADAVLATGARDAIEPFRDFLSEYRADPAFVNEPGPLIAAAEVLLKLGSTADRALLLFVMEEPKTVSALRVSLRRALAQTSGAPAGDPSAE